MRGPCLGSLQRDLHPRQLVGRLVDEQGIRLSRLDRVPRVEGQEIWFDHRDPANPCCRRKPAWLDPDILEYKPEILAILKAQNRRTVP